MNQLDIAIMNSAKQADEEWFEATLAKLAEYRDKSPRYMKDAELGRWIRQALNDIKTQRAAENKRVAEKYNRIMIKRSI